MTAIQKISQAIGDLDLTITNYKLNSSTLDTLASQLALKSLERRRSEMLELLQSEIALALNGRARTEKIATITSSPDSINRFKKAIEMYGIPKIQAFAAAFNAQPAPFLIS